MAAASSMSAIFLRHACVHFWCQKLYAPGPYGGAESAGHEIAGQENAGHEIAGQENAGHAKAKQKTSSEAANV